MKKYTVFACLLSLAAAPAFAQGNAPGQSGQGSAPAMGQAGQTASVSMADIQDWSETSKKAAQAMLDKYGQPNEATASMWIWHDNGPWKRTIVYSQEIDHNFPVPHKDVLEQFVNYNAPEDKYDELAQFDGSVIVERTKAELSARCDKEGANFLAVNLANDVATGQKSVEEARRFYADTMKQFMQTNQPAEYMQGLVFDVAQENLNEPDVAYLEKPQEQQTAQK
jgi:hypothetical protein